MAIPVKLSDVVEAMDVPDDEWSVCLNRRTGEIVTITAEDESLLDDPAAQAGASAWELEQLEIIRQARESDEYLALPDKFELHEWSIMERFAGSLDDVEQRNRLDRALHGRGAFRCFEEGLSDLELRDAWFRFRDDALEHLAATWLADHGVPFERAH